MARKLPPVNARVTQVRAPSTTDDFDATPAPGAIIWQGSADAHVTERALVAAGREGSDLNVVTSLVVPSAVPATSGCQVTFERGDYVTDPFAIPAQPVTRLVRDLEPRPDFGFTRLYFENA